MQDKKWWERDEGETKLSQKQLRRREKFVRKIQKGVAQLRIRTTSESASELQLLQESKTKRQSASPISERQPSRNLHAIELHGMYLSFNPKLFLNPLPFPNHLVEHSVENAILLQIEFH